MSTQSVTFEPIDITQGGKTIFESKIFIKESGKDITPLEETKFINQKYSGFAALKFITDPSKRDFIKIELDRTQPNCLELKQILSVYDDSFKNSSIKTKLDDAKIITYNNSVKLPESGDEDKEYCKLKMKTNWFYYYEGVRLDKTNSDIIRNVVAEHFKNNPKLATANKDKKKDAVLKLNVELKFKNDDGEDIVTCLSMKDIEQRKEFNTKIFYRKLETLPTGYKKPTDCTEEELVQYYGDPGDPLDIRTPEQFDEIYGHKHDEGYKHHNYYIRMIFVPSRLWASKTLKQCGIKYVIELLDIIHLPNENSYSASTQRTAYGQYAFGKKSAHVENLLITESSDTSDTIFNATTSTTASTSTTTATTSNAKQTTKELKVESDNDESGGSGSDNDDSADENDEDTENDDSDESEESDASEEPVKTIAKNTKNTKTVVGSKPVIEAKPVVEAKQSAKTSSSKRTK